MKTRLIFRRLAWAALALLVLMALAWWLVPLVVKSQIEQRGSAVLGRAVGVDSVSFTPWALRLTLYGLSVAGAAGDTDPTPQLAIERVFVDASLRTLIERAPVIEAFELDAPRLRLARMAPGRYDVDDVLLQLNALREQPLAPGDEEPARFAVFNVQLRGGEVNFDDRAVNSRHEVRGLTLGLPFVSNLPTDIAVRVEPRLAAVVDGSALDLQGHTLPFSPDRASELKLKFSALPLARWWAYVPADLPLRPSGGVLDSEITVRFAQPAGADARLTLSGRVSVDDMAVATRDGAPMVGWRRLVLGLDDVRPLERIVALSSVELDGLSADLRRAAAGRLQWQTLFDKRDPAAVAAAPVLAAASAAAPAPAPAPVAIATTARAASWQVSLARLAVSHAELRWRDASTPTAAAIDIRPLQLQAESLAWPSTTPSPVKLTVQLHAGPQADKPAGQAELQGTVSAQAASLSLALADVDVSAAGPYLQAWLKPRLDGQLSTSARIDWTDGEKPTLLLSIAGLRLQDLGLAGSSANTNATASAKATASARGADSPLRVATLELDDARVDLLARQIGLGVLQVRDPAIRLARTAGGEWSPAAWLAAPAVSPAGDPAASAPRAPWRAELKELRLNGGRLQLDDAAAGRRPVSLSLRSVQLGVRGLVWPASAAPAAFDVSALWPDAQVASAPPAKLQARGKFTLAPFGVRASIDAERLPLHVVQPYVPARLPVLLRRAELGYKGDIDLTLGPDGPTIAMKGDALLADLRLQTDVARAVPRAAVAAVPAGNELDGDEGGEELLAWQSLTLRPLSVRLQPGARPAVEIGEAVLSDFFSRLFITEQGRFNLLDVQGESVPAGQAATASPQMAAAPVPAASAPGPVAVEPAGGRRFDLVVGSTRLVGGRIDFNDRFIRPNYSAQLTDLNGTIGRFSSGSRDMATLDLRGRAAGTALLEIRGALNPTVDPLALDISARVTDLELAPFSPYASKYAGYAIERGKLSLDIAYRIDPDGKLGARNQLVLNQLTFGERVEGPDVTTLPVRLAVSLLTDRNGVIDVNLPISGSINDPQFSVVGLVFQVIGNLIAKAITAPFALMAGGGGEDLSQIEFVPGTTTIAETSTPALQRVAQALTDRPALRMTVTGTADPVSEREAMQRAALEARLRTEQRRELARAGTAAGASAVLPPLSVAERTRLVSQIYSETRLPNKPRNLVGLNKTLPLAEMEALLMQATDVSADSARELALQRGLAVREALVGKGLPAERLFLAEPKLRGVEDEAAAWAPRVNLSLSAS
jgi:hypothetical protein